VLLSRDRESESRPRRDPASAVAMDEGRRPLDRGLVSRRDNHAGRPDRRPPSCACDAPPRWEPAAGLEPAGRRLSGRGMPIPFTPARQRYVGAHAPTGFLRALARGSQYANHVVDARCSSRLGSRGRSAIGAPCGAWPRTGGPWRRPLTLRLRGISRMPTRRASTRRRPTLMAASCARRAQPRRAATLLRASRARQRLRRAAFGPGMG
jgi:hypothetical protein